MRRSDDRSRDSRRSRDHVDEERSRELERKRREWRIEQEKRREHEKRKQKMIEEWEAKRARELELKKQRRRSKSRSRSASPGASRRRGRSRSGESRRSRVSSNRVPVMSEKCDSSSTSNTPLFKGSEGSKISVNELKKIKVNIQREISNAEETPELLRDITSPDEIVLKRREGLSPKATRLRGNGVQNVSVGSMREGANPVFEREDIKVNDSSEDEVPERRTIVAVDEICGDDIPERRTVVFVDASPGDEVRERKTIVTVDKIETDKRSSSKRSRSVSSDRHKSRSSRRPSSATQIKLSRFCWYIMKIVTEKILKITSIGRLMFPKSGEGSKPIFEREELKTEKSTTVDVPERRTVVAVDKIDSGEKRSSARRSRSLSLGRNTSRSSHRASRYDTVSKSYAEDHGKFHSYDRDSSRSNDRYHERKHPTSRQLSSERVRDSRSRRSPDRDRDLHPGSHRESGYREYREYDSHSHHRRSEVDRRSTPLSYAEPIPFPMYYDNLVRPMMVDPMMMLRTQLPVMRGRMPPIMTPFRPPFRPRFMPPEMFRPNAHPNQRYNRMYQ